MILEKVYQRIHTYHNTDGKVTEEGRKVSMERGFSKGVGHLKEETGNRIDYDIS
jgi:hypothetical protein